MSLNNRVICNALFVEMEPNLYSCNTCTQSVRSTNGYTNLLSHLRRHHPAYEELARGALADANQLRLRVVDQRTVDIFRWLEWTVMERLPFSFCDRPLARANAKMSSVSRKTLMSYMRTVTECVEARIKHELPDVFGLVLDGWSDGGRHYLAIFAVFSDTRVSDTAHPVTDRDYYEDLDCHKRRYVLLAFCPLWDEEDLGAQSIFDLMADTLSRYDKPWESVAFMVGDNCSVNQCIGRAVGAVPLIGCASHRFNLAMKDYLEASAELLGKIHALMKRLSTLKGRALLRRVTPLAPILRNETRWSSTYAMVSRYSEIEACIRTLDHGTLAEYDLGSMLLSRRDHDRAIALLGHLDELEGVTKTLQRSSLTLSGTRRLFDRVIATYPEMTTRLSDTAPIITSPALESGLVRIQRNEPLSPSERAACASFKQVAPDAAAATAEASEVSSIVKEAFKRRRVQRRVPYMDVGFVPPTSNECERFFSAAKLQLTDIRKSMDVESIEEVMMLSYNRELWDVYTVEMIRTNTVRD